MVKVINKKTMNEMRVKQNRVDSIKIYSGNAKTNLAAKEVNLKKLSDDVKTKVRMTTEEYSGSLGEEKLWNEISDLVKKINAAQAPAQADIDALIGKFFIDITRRAQEAGDLTSFFATEINDPNAAETVNTRFLYKYVGKMGVVKGTNDSVNLIEQKLGETDSFDLTIKAVGWKDSLRNLLYNTIHDAQKVNQAAVDADVDERNAAIIGTIVGTTFDASQKQAADATANASFDSKMYNTLRKGIKKLRALKDVQTNRKIAVPGISLLCNSSNTWDIVRVINGQLTTAGTDGTINATNAQALPIDNIIEYDQGINDGVKYGKDTLSFPGVTVNKCYLFIPREYLWVVNKRGLTLETGQGETLQLSTEERAWYRVQGEFFKDFLGSSFPGTALGAGYGAIIEVTLPTES